MRLVIVPCVVKQSLSPTMICVQGLTQGRVACGCIGAAVTLLAALVRVSGLNDEFNDWAVLLMQSAEVAMAAELKDRPAPLSASCCSSRRVLLKVLELVGEVALHGLHVPPSIGNAVQALTADMPLPATGVIDVEVRAVAVLALGKIATSDSVLARRWAPAFARHCSTHSCPLVRNNSMLVRHCCRRVCNNIVLSFIIVDCCCCFFVAPLHFGSRHHMITVCMSGTC
jgi:hypothetical protein